MLLFLVYFIHLSVFSHGTPFIGLEVKLQWEVLFALCRPFYKFQGRKAVYFSHICFVLILCDIVCWMLFFLASSEMGNLHCCKMLKPNLIVQNCCVSVFVSNGVLCSETILNWCYRALILNLKLYVLVLLCKNRIYLLQYFLKNRFNVRWPQVKIELSLHFNKAYFKEHLRCSLF